MERMIEQVHLQITRNCNLRCYFCGQWGKNGFFSDASGKEMTLADWENVIFQLIRYREKTGISPFVMLWGGEPLVSPYFDQIAGLLQKEGFHVGMVTNGVLLERHMETVNQCVQKVFVSLDGTQKLHDSIRGRGVFEKVLENIRQLTKPKITIMTVVTEPLIVELSAFLLKLNEYPVKELYLQDQIGLTSEEIKQYQEMMEKEFGICAKEIEGWQNDGRLLFHEEVEKELAKIDLSSLHYSIYQKKHDTDLTMHCYSPFRHMHIAWNGNVLYCTDFYDFSAGNVKQNDIETIFLNEQSEQYRSIITQGRCATCRHCSWKNNRNYRM